MRHFAKNPRPCEALRLKSRGVLPPSGPPGAHEQGRWPATALGGGSSRSVSSGAGFSATRSVMAEGRSAGAFPRRTLYRIGKARSGWAGLRLADAVRGSCPTYGSRPGRTSRSSGAKSGRATGRPVTRCPLRFSEARCRGRSGYLQVFPPGRPRHLFEQQSASDVQAESTGRQLVTQSLSLVPSQALGQQPSPSWQAGSS